MTLLHGPHTERMLRFTLQKIKIEQHEEMEAKKRALEEAAQLEEEEEDVVEEDFGDD